MILYQVIRTSGPHYTSDWWDLWKSDSHYDALFRLVFHSIILKADTSIDQQIALHNSLEIYTFDDYVVRQLARQKGRIHCRHLHLNIAYAFESFEPLKNLDALVDRMYRLKKVFIGINDRITITNQKVLSVSKKIAEPGYGDARVLIRDLILALIGRWKEKGVSVDILLGSR